MPVKRSSLPVFEAHLIIHPVKDSLRFHILDGAEIHISKLFTAPKHGIKVRPTLNVPRRSDSPSKPPIEVGFEYFDVVND